MEVCVWKKTHVQANIQHAPPSSATIERSDFSLAVCMSLFIEHVVDLNGDFIENSLSRSTASNVLNLYLFLLYYGALTQCVTLLPAERRAWGAGWRGHTPTVWRGYETGPRRPLKHREWMWHGCVRVGAR